MLLFELAGDLGRYLFREGRWRADPMHLDLINAVQNYVSGDIANVIGEQLQRPYFISWWSKGRINVFFFYRRDRLPIISDPKFRNALFSVDLRLEGRKRKAHVTFYEGRVFSVELKLPRKVYKNKEYRIGAVTEGKPKDTFTAVIDRTAHGKETETNP